MPSRNGLNLGILSAATAAAAAAAAAAASNKDNGCDGGLLNPGFPFATPTIPGTNVPMFPPMMDMSSTQALLSMVRSSQFDAFMSGKNGGGSGGTKRPCSTSSSSSNNPLHPHNVGSAAAASASEQNPLDLSSSSSPCKKPRKGHPPVGHWDSAAAGSFAETFLNIPAFGLALQKSWEKVALTCNGGNGRRLGSVSPKPSKAPSKQPPCHQAAPSRALPCASACSAPSAAPTATADKHNTCPNAADKSAVSSWTVDDVCDFVGTIDLCAEYSQVSSIKLPMYNNYKIKFCALFLVIVV